MDRTELRAILDEEAILPDAYSLEGGLPEDRLCIDEEYGQWAVYYVERGQRRQERRFATEDEACRHLLELLKAAK
ncbi:MAG: hypothetical protein FWE35_07975 [Streptosporangiales bacterium]|nr:hypothetical protein [Streptosporangiales bacterium]